MNILAQHLTYRWLCDSTGYRRGNVFFPLQVTSKWKPILVFSKGKWKKRGRWCDVFAYGEKEKDLHKWQQPLPEVEMIVRYLSKQGDLVCDPCAGSFTAAVACRNLGRPFVGCDIDRDNVLKGQARVAELAAQANNDETLIQTA